MIIQNILSGQLKHPSGMPGIITGLLMDYTNRSMYRMLLDASEIANGDHILEAGFGSGKHIKHIVSAKSGITYTGVDLSDTMIKYARRYNRELVNSGKVRIEKADFSELPFGSSVFNKVLTINTIYFWKNPEIVISELSRVLVEGGILAIGANPGEEMKRSGYREKYFRFWEQPEVEHLLIKNGYTIIKSFYSKLTLENCFCVIAKKNSR